MFFARAHIDLGFLTTPPAAGGENGSEQSAAVWKEKIQNTNSELKHMSIKLQWKA